MLPDSIHCNGLERFAAGQMPRIGSRRWAAATSGILLLCLLGVGPLACRRPQHTDNDGFSVLQRISPQPLSIGPAQMDIRILDTYGKPVPDAAVTLEAEMSHPGMSPVFAKAAEQSPGTYIATLNFTMGGDWVVLTHIELPAGRKIERQMDVKGVRSH